jgi:pectate lyase
MASSLAHGFASLNGGTSGGSGGSTVTVSTGRELLEAIKAAGSAPLTVRVDGEITTGNTGAEVIDIADVHNLSIIGTGDGAEFDGIGIRIKDGSSNIIIQNLSIHDVGSGPKDAIGMEGGAHNIWIDHNEFYSSMSVGKDEYDGLLDMKRGVEYVTVSNNNFHDHHKVSLNGYSDSDEGARYVTYSGNIFENIGSRAPSIRDGYVHVYNNYYSEVETSAINLRMGAEGLIENNVFENVRDPIVSLDSKEIGYWNLRGNELDNVSWGNVGGDEASAADGKSTTHYDVPYDYELASASEVKAEVLSHAGVGRLGSGAGAGKPATADGDTDGNDGSSDGETSSEPSDGEDLKGAGNADPSKESAADEVLSAVDSAGTPGKGDGNGTLSLGTSSDALSGGNTDDTLDREAGRGELVFTSIEESPAGDGRSVITNFNPSADQIDLSRIDARTDRSGDQDFAFIGADDFARKAGELRIDEQEALTLVEADVDGDGEADFQIALPVDMALKADDFVL